MPASASNYVADPTLPPEQTHARVDFTNKLVEDAETKALAQDSRASGEKERILEAWGELKAIMHPVEILERHQFWLK